MIVSVADAVDVEAYVLTGAIDGSTVCGEDLVEARHRGHGLRILVTMDALFRDWRQPLHVPVADWMGDHLARVDPRPLKPCRCGRRFETARGLGEPWPDLDCDCCFAPILGAVRGTERLRCGVCRP